VICKFWTCNAGASAELNLIRLLFLQVGIIPTDSLPAVVCDLENRTAALKMYNVMELAPKKQLSILVGSFNDISK
jgi:tRNA A37 threonylcarbamoyladenosine synthetase subunit TsaC/SUA5/YrdC